MCTHTFNFTRFLLNSPPKWCNGWTFPIAVYESFCSSTSQFYSLHMLRACYVYAKSLQSCPTLCNPLDCSPSGSSVHGILQARILEWVAMPSSRDVLPDPGISFLTQGSNLHLLWLLHCRWVLYCWATGEALVHIFTCCQSVWSYI